MHTLPDVKAMAKALRAAMAERDIFLNHSDCLELVAQQLGHANWKHAAGHDRAPDRFGRSDDRT